MTEQNLAQRCSFPAKLAMLSLAALLIQSCAQPAPAQSPTPAPTAAQPSATPGPLSHINTVTLNGVVYNDTAAALAAYRDIEEKPVAGLSREADPLKGRALIVLPDHDRLRPLVSQEQLILRKQAVIGDALDFFIEQRRVSLHALADALSQNGSFENVTVVEQNDVLNPELGNADFLVWYQVRTQLPNNQGAWLGQWQVRRNTNPAVNGAGVDPGTAPGTPRYASFTKSVREAALRLGGRSISGITSASMGGGNGAANPAVSGSGIIIDTQGHVLTNEHVIRSCTDPRITDTSNLTYRATIMAKDTANDLALLKAEHRWPEAASFRDGREPRPGEPVVVTGYPLAGVTGSGMAVTTGSVTSLTGPRDDSRLLQLSAPVQPGNSGGPLLDNNGHVTGVVTSTLNGMVLALATGVVPQNVNFAVKAGIARNFLDTQDINYAHAPAGRELAAGDIGQLAKKFTVRINCGGTL